MANDEIIAISDPLFRREETKSDESSPNPFGKLAEDKDVSVFIKAFKEQVFQLLTDVKKRCDHHHAAF